MDFEDDGASFRVRRLMQLEQMANQHGADRLVILNGRYTVEPTEPHFVYKWVMRILAATASTFVGLIVISILITIFEHITG